MAIEVNPSQAPVVVHKGWATLHGRLVGHLVSFLEPKEILKAGTICKLWHQNEFVDTLMQRALRSDFPPDGLTRAQFAQYHRNSRTGAFQVRRLALEEGMQFVSWSSLQPYFFAVAQDMELCKVYDNLGRPICSLNMKAVKREAGQKLLACSDVFLTEEELFLSIRTGCMTREELLSWLRAPRASRQAASTPIPTVEESGRSIMCVFARKGGGFLRQFPFPYDMMNPKRVCGVYEREIIWIQRIHNFETQVSVTDLSGNELWKKSFPCSSQYVQFNKERRSFFFLSKDHVLTEHMFHGKEETRLDLSKHLAPSKSYESDYYFEMNANMLLLYRPFRDREIRMYDLQAKDPQKPLCVFRAHYRKDFMDNNYDSQEITLFHDKIFVPGKSEDLLHDKQGNRLASFAHCGKLNKRFFPWGRERFLHCADANSEGGWSLCNSSGERLRTFTFPLSDSRSWNVQCSRPDKIFICQAGLSLLDFTAPPEEGKKQ